MLSQPNDTSRSTNRNLLLVKNFDKAAEIPVTELNGAIIIVCNKIYMYAVVILLCNIVTVTVILVSS